MWNTDRRRWRAATTLADMAELTAQWLTGDMRRHPAYGMLRSPGPDPETSAIAADLAAINRAGFLTDSSQPGEETTSHGGFFYRQRAAVEGFMSPAAADRLEKAAAGQDGIVVIVHRGKLPRRRADYSRLIPVSMSGHRVNTEFGAYIDRRYLTMSYDWASREALDALCSARQVTVIDLTWGRNTMWSWLVTALATTRITAVVPDRTAD
jgi:hypothetical protein